MTLITYHTSTLILQAERLFSTTELGGILKSALHALGETGCDAATVTFTGVTVSGDSLEAALDVNLTRGGTELVLSLGGAGLPDKAVQARLAGLVYHLCAALPVTHIAWLETGTLLPRTRFMEALAPKFAAPVPAPVAPRRPTRTLADTNRPTARMHRRTLARMMPAVDGANRNGIPTPHRYDAHVRAYDANVKACMLRSADDSELAAMRAEHGLAGSNRLRVASIALTLAGVILATDTSNAMAGVLSVF